MLHLVLLFACSFLPPVTSSPCPPNMAFVEADRPISWGEVRATQPWQLPKQQQFVASFCMDQYEYPNQVGSIPLAKVSWQVASAKCAEQNKRLCTEAEWELACRGLEKRLYVYGNKRQTDICNADAISPEESVKVAPSGSHQHCHSPQGIYDLNGNLSEWVADDWRSFDHNQQRWKPQKSGYKTLRGGTMWRQTHYGQDCTSRHGHHLHSWQNSDDGFRCCASPDHSPS